ncbi:helix-turn-helix domain-containing protein [Poseidonocella sedimentorum]|uniref:HTH cro/C1-type domain-containing protein n=1 Tax=Poseidonocella sedimentorum TaxID=871652 RepID=A0A1I6EKR9_9RHOB|nr:XRE family transcriptional regulator [Poseidonocella sedimentorum]SFR18227.1 hypothetical protein SAMN04515673_11371 [Poseidonocella sedimentorum]
MSKTLIGPRLRELRRSRNQTQAEMARSLSVSPAYINLLENNQRSLSVQMLLSISDTYGVDWRDLTQDDSARVLADLRHAFNDPIFAGERPALAELRGAIDYAPRLVDLFLTLHKVHRAALDIMMRYRGEVQADELLKSAPEGIIHDYFRKHSNHFSELELAAEELRARHEMPVEMIFSSLRDILQQNHGIGVKVRRIDDMDASLRIYDEKAATVYLSQALNTENRAFQLAHVLGLVHCEEIIDGLVESSGIQSEQALPRLRVELANYFAAAIMMPYAPFLEEAETAAYDIDRIAAAFGTSYEQVCQRLTTMQREGALGVPFFFMRLDRAGNVTKRFNATSFNLAEYGGSCPVWNIHSAFHTPGVVMPQFVELPDGQRFFTFSRTVHRPVFSEKTQDRRLTLTLGCAAEYAPRLRYASRFKTDDPDLYAEIGIACHLCPRKACSQRAHQPLYIDLPIDAYRRGSTRHES